MASPHTLDTDDLDDLDDVLDQFKTSPAPPPPTASNSSSGRPRTNTRVDAPPISVPGSGLENLPEGDEDALAADFAAELAKGMESLMREIGSAAGVPASGEAGAEAALKAAWEAMLVEGMDGVAEGSTAAAAGESTDFQRKIQQTMGKLREGEETLKDAPSDPGADTLEALLAQLKDLGDGSDLPASESDLAGFLENMMSELMSKEVLYEPLTELAEKFPPYLASPPSPLSAEDRTRYEAQLGRVRAILAVFDAPTFNDSDPKSRESVVALMSEMQSFGSPPTELMGPLPPGLNGMGDEGCTIA
ncbi:Pex19 protein family-domain-containing protein [Roridomyces roridus]|uniref:Pex19 protein family-domain-containing protein n=1 Tax=Roridomyces roridus TaxID=1738132 RepID=A0AAD7FEL2_9AGAR|nr:Pex19 protein family-domain-containing protein [Roridomyces roridus]